MNRRPVWRPGCANPPELFDLLYGRPKRPPFGPAEVLLLGLCCAGGWVIATVLYHAVTGDFAWTA